jgi:hypothetical protein
MANYENTQDLKQEVLQHCGELTDGTSEYDAKAITFLNRAYQAMLSGAAELGMDVGQPWPWAKSPYPGIIVIQPEIRTVLANVTNNSSAVTLSANYSPSLQNYYIRFSEQGDLYRVTAHTSGTNAVTLDSAYVGSTAALVSTRILKFDYELSQNMLRLIGPFKVSRNNGLSFSGEVPLIDLNTFNADYPLGVNLGVPFRVTEVSQSGSMLKTVRFNCVPGYNDQAVRVLYDYIPVPAALTDSPSSIPLVPRDQRINLVYYAAYFLLMNKNDNRAAEYRELARAGMLAMVRALKVQKANTDPNYGRFIPRQDGQGYYNLNRRWEWE